MEPDIVNAIHDLISRSKHILSLSDCPEVKNVAGINKFRRKVKKELLFLEGLLQPGCPLTSAFVKCSNLQHLEALITYAIQEPECTSILQGFKYTDSLDQTKKLIVDVVSHGGARWNKISARNPKALTLNSSEHCVFGVRSVLDQAEDYLECAREHPFLFQNPEIVFHFASGIESSLAADLRNIEIIVSGDILDEYGLLVVEEPVSSSSDTRTNYNALNLDVSSMMAYISSSTNGGCHARISSVVLSNQAKREQSHHVKEMLDKLFEGKELYCCRTAEEDFKSILKTIAGTQEKRRAEEFLKKIKVVPDNLSERSKTLQVKGKIKKRSVIIFGTGDSLKMPTVSANAGFVRAAQHQGVNFVAILHESRALTEAKEIHDQT